MPAAARCLVVSKAWLVRTTGATFGRRWMGEGCVEILLELLLIGVQRIAGRGSLQGVSILIIVAFLVLIRRLLD
jgi:hypothetical protein